MPREHIVEIWVFDSTGAPVPGARIWIRAGPPVLRDLTVVTNERGQSFLSLPEGPGLEFVCSAAGYSQQTLEVAIEATTETVTFTLGPDD
ncbi:MAG: carboxypeptidase-like regulatory domain-containing protein [Thalassobaculaceae bacterium]|nr:carboxypeptidase-like regulatory domain-containing protein [Thalassobaculaceae bacterium]